MGWFDEQLRSRKQNDNENFEDAFLGIAGAVMGKRLAVSLQDNDLSDTALEEVLKYFNCKIKTDELPKDLKTAEEKLDYRLRPFGIFHREVKLEKGWYKCAVGPMLATLKQDGSAVALIPGKLGGYYFYNFSTGNKIKLNKKTELLLDEQATCFYKPLPLKKLTMWDLVVFMKEQLSLADILLYVGMMAVVTLLGLLTPMFTKWLFGDVLQSGSVKVLLSLAVFMVMFSISQLLLQSFQSLIYNRIGIKQNIAVQSAVMSRLMSLPSNFFKNYSAGELTQRSSYVQSLCETILSTIGNTGLTSLFSLVYIGQIFAFAPSLVAPALLVTLATVLLTLVTTFKQMKITQEKMLLETKESGITYSMITGIQKIKLAGAEKRMFARWANHYRKEAELTYNPPKFLQLNTAFSMFISLTGSLVLYWMAVKNGVSVADYYAFNSAYGMSSSAFMSLASIAITLANIKPTLEMAKPIMEAEPEITDGKEIVTALRGGIEINNLSFRYSENMPYIFDNLSLKIRPGEFVAVVGKTGCGKSTLIRLLLGFEKPLKGAIYYDQKDINTVDAKSLRKKIGCVTQNGKLIMGDIFSNIIISSPMLTLNDAWRAAEIASIADDIRAMPMGMNTIISEGQGGISGGQKQRLMIARAVASSPKILIFDEATSALDNVTQRKVSDAIDALKCTRIVIAHRLSTIRHADRILVLDGGKIVEDGTYEQLIEQKGFFAELVERQRLDNNA